MASVTPVAGEGGFAPHLLGGPTHSAIVSRNPMPARPVAPAIERVASVRILRGSANWRGVALRLANSAGDDERFELALTAGDGVNVFGIVPDGVRSVAVTDADTGLRHDEQVTDNVYELAYKPATVSLTLPGGQPVTFDVLR